MRLKDRVAIVTGAASGIGAASALAMASEGARVLVVDLNETGAKTTVEIVAQVLQLDADNEQLGSDRKALRPQSAMVVAFECNQNYRCGSGEGE